MSIGVELTLILFAILLNGVFAAAEIALVSARVGRLASFHTAGAGMALRLEESPQTFLATIQVGITLVGTLASAVGGATAVEALTPIFRELGLGQAAQPVALGLVVVVLTYFSLVLGELAPKAIALQNPERLAALAARPIHALSRVSAGLIRVLTASTSAVLRLCGVGTVSESPFISEEEVRYLVREGAAKGIFEKDGGGASPQCLRVRRHDGARGHGASPEHSGHRRGDVKADVSRRVAEIGHSRIPVYRDDISRPVGILLMRDVLTACAEGRMPRGHRDAAPADVRAGDDEDQRGASRAATATSGYGAGRRRVRQRRGSDRHPRHRGGDRR